MVDLTSVQRRPTRFLAAKANADLGLPPGAIGFWDFTNVQSSPSRHFRNLLSGTPPSKNLLRMPRRQFGDSVFWAVSNATVTDAVVTAPDGTTSATTVVYAGGGAWYVAPGGGAWSFPANTYTIAVSVRWAGTGSTDFRLGVFPSNLATKTASASWQRFSTTVTWAGGVMFILIYTPDGSSAANLEICDFEMFEGSSDLGPTKGGKHIYVGKYSADTVPTTSGGCLDVSGGGASALLLDDQVQFSAVTAIFVSSCVSTGFNTAIRPVLSYRNTSWANFEIGAGPFISLNGSDKSPSLQGTFYNTWAAPSSGLKCHAVRYAGTTSDIWMNGNKLVSASVSATSFTLADVTVGVLQTSYYAGHKFYALALYNRALSDDEVRQASSAVMQYLAKRSSVVPKERIVVTVGDSISAGTGGGGYLASVAQNVTKPITAVTLGLGGVTVGGMASTTADALLGRNQGDGKTWILHIHVGTNDLTGGTAAATVASNLATYIAARRAAGWRYIVVDTIISRTSTDVTSGIGQSTFDSRRATLNATIRSWVGSTIDACADFGDGTVVVAAATTVGANTAADSATYFGDKIHPTAAGYGVMGPIIATALDTIS